VCYQERVIADAPQPVAPIPAAQLPASADAVVIGAGMVGAAVAAWLAATGRRVCVIDRTGPLGGTSASGEGNILLSDKLPGPELSLALRSTQLWLDLAEQAGDAVEFERKGGVVVAASQPQLDALAGLAEDQRAAGVQATALDAAALREAEPQLAPGLPGGAFYPQDCQVQPMRAAMACLSRAAATGRLTVTRAEATGLLPRHGAAHLVTDRGQVAAPVVVNAAGPWGGEVARRLGSFLPVRPRRGHILVTEPLPVLVKHKVYESDYVGAVASDGGKVWAHAVLRDSQGKLSTFEPGQVDFSSRREWRSPRTGTSYPVASTVKTGTVEWRLDPLMDDQELDSTQSTGAVYWEGAVTVSRDGKAVGRGYLELTGYNKALDLDK